VRIIVPLPKYGFDPTEASIPWKILSNQGHTFIFSTPEARVALADERMLQGHGLSIWKTILQARADAVDAYAQMCLSTAFQNPVSYESLKPEMADALLLPGGHDKGMRTYLESPYLHALVKHFLGNNKPVAICHGVVLAARSGGLFDYKTTALLKSQEMTAYHLTRGWLGDYYRTYPETVEAEVKSCLRDKGQFITGPLPLSRDTLQKPFGFTVRDRNYLSARWPGDAYAFALQFGEMLR
jgi:protease I